MNQRNETTIFPMKTYSTNLIEQFIQHIAKYSQEISKKKISSLGWIAFDFIELTQRTESTSSQLIQLFSPTTKPCSLVTMVLFSSPTASLHHHHHWRQQIFQWNPLAPHQQRSSPFPHHHLVSLRFQQIWVED